MFYAHLRISFLSALFLIACAALFLAAVNPLYAQNNEPVIVAPGEVLIIPTNPNQPVAKGRADASLQQLKQQYDIQQVRSLSQRYQMELWSVPEGQEEAIIDQINAANNGLTAMRNVGRPLPETQRSPFLGSTAKPNPQVQSTNDPFYGNQYALPMMDAPQAWGISTGSEDVLVVIMDTGIDPAHPDLVGNLWVNPGEIAGNGIDDDGNGFVDDVHGWDTYLDTGTLQDTDGHGTHVSGIIGAQGNNSIGVTGINQEVSLVGLNVFREDGFAYSSEQIEGFEYVDALLDAGHNVVALNQSLGGLYTFSEINSAALEWSRFYSASHASKNCIWVIAAGNDSKNLNEEEFFALPAEHHDPNIITVASSDGSDNMSSFSNYGRRQVEVAAPGSSILSTIPGGTYGYMGGTSMATPYVAGLIALAASVYPDEHYSARIARIMATGNSGSAFTNTTVSGKRINAHLALANNWGNGLYASASPTLARFKPDESYVAFSLGLVNQTGGAITFSNYSFTGPDAARFEFLSASQTGSVASGGAIGFGIQLNKVPGQEQYSANVSVTTSAGTFDLPIEVDTYQEPEALIGLSPYSEDLGSIEAGNQISDGFTVLNTGNADLTFNLVFELNEVGSNKQPASFVDKQKPVPTADFYPNVSEQVLQQLPAPEGYVPRQGPTASAIVSPQSTEWVYQSGFDSAQDSPGTWVVYHASGTQWNFFNIESLYSGYGNALATGNPTQTYADNTLSRAGSPLIDIESQIAAGKQLSEIRFDYALELEEGYDFLKVDLIDDSQTVLATLASSENTFTNDGAFHTAVIPVSQFNITQNFRLRFTFETDFSVQAGFGAMIDNVKIGVVQTDDRIDISPASGTIAAGQNAAVNYTINTTELTATDYAFNTTLSSNATNNPQSLGAGTARYQSTFAVAGAQEKILTLSGSFEAQDKVYDGTTTAQLSTNNVILEGIQGGEQVSIAGLTLAFDTENVGAAKSVSITEVQLTGADAGSYTLSLVGSPKATAQISPREVGLSGSFVVNDKVYDGTRVATASETALNLTNVVSGDVLDIAGFVFSFEDASVGVNKTVSIDSLYLGGADIGNYFANVVGTPQAQADISPKPLTVEGSFTASDKVYDATTDVSISDTVLSLAGAVGVEEVALDQPLFAFDSSSAGQNRVVRLVSGDLTGAHASNYTLSLAGAPTATADILVKPLRITGSFSAADKSFDGSATATLSDISGLGLDSVLAGDQVSLAPDSLQAAFASAQVGTDIPVNLTKAALQGAQVPNYALSLEGAPTTTASIGAAALSLSGSFSVQDKVYDGTAAATLASDELTLEGLDPGKDVVLTGIELAFADSAAGTAKTVQIISAQLSGPDAGDFTLSLAGAPTATADILVQPLRITGSFSVADKSFDGSMAATLSDVSGLGLDSVLAGDQVSLAPDSLQAAFASAEVGQDIQVSLTSAALTGLQAPNYALSLDGAPTATASIGAAALSLAGSFSVQDKVYDGTAAATLATSDLALQGLPQGADVSVGQLELAFTDSAAGTAKTVQIISAQLSGPDAGDYSLTLAGAPTATADILVKDLTISVRSDSVEYTGEAFSGGFGVDFDGLIAEEDISVLEGALIYGGSAQGAIEPGEYILSASGLASPNYEITWVEGTLVIKAFEAPSEAVDPITDESEFTTERQPIFIWRSVERASSYRLQLEWVGSTTKSPQTLSTVLDTSITDTTLQVPFDLQTNARYQWRVQALNQSGAGPWSDWVELLIEQVTHIEEEAMPTQFVLHQNYPNPFNPTTSISYEINTAAQVRLAVYDLSGREMAVLVDRNQASGRYTVSFDAANLPSGVYIYRLTADAFTQMRKMTLVK